MVKISFVIVTYNSEELIKDCILSIYDYADLGMSVRGQYYPNNKEIAPGDRKLFLQIESLTERGLHLAKAEVARLIKEEMMKMIISGGSAAPTTVINAPGIPATL